jgi:hypothetical protein
MIATTLILAVCLPVQARLESAADRVELRDRSIVLGQVLEPAPPGKLVLAVRRAWVKEHIPSLLKTWERQEARWVQRARDQRLDRLRTWKRERPVAAGAAADPLADWIDAEVRRMEVGPREPTSLMAVELDRGQVRRLVRQPVERARMLRQAWRGGLPDPETRPVDELKDQLEGRGFALSEVDPAPIDALLPLPFENDARWLARRAATEVARETGLRFVRYLGVVLPEGANADGTGLAGAAVTALKGLLGDEPQVDPLASKLTDAARRGRVGVVVTKLDMAEDLSTVTVESALWVRTDADRWAPAVVRPATVRVRDVSDDEARPLGGDPQVQAAFRVAEALGLGDVAPELKQRSLTMGAATRRALGQAQAALARDLDALALSTDPPPRRE